MATEAAGASTPLGPSPPPLSAVSASVVSPGTTNSSDGLRLVSLLLASHQQQQQQQHKGMVNRPGDNHCFINCVVQILWHLKQFRDQFNERHGHGNSTPGQHNHQGANGAATTNGEAAKSRAGNVVAALADVFKAFESEDPNTVVECHPLRIALSEEDKDGRFFQLNQMDDAVECYEEVLRSLHEGEKGAQASAMVTRRMSMLNATQPPKKSGTINATKEASNVCQPACLVHEVMAMSVQEQFTCGCGAKSQPIKFDKFIQYVPASMLLQNDLQVQSRITLRQLESISGFTLNLQSPSSGDTATMTPETPQSLNYDIVDFGQLLGLVLTNETKICPEKASYCKETCTSSRPMLLNYPSVFSIGINWHTTSLSAEDLDNFMLALAPVISLGDVFETSNVKKSQTLQRQQSDPGTLARAKKSLLLQGMIAYYGLHYVAFFFSEVENAWMMYDDTTVRHVGPYFSDLVNKCRKGRYQPSVLFYQTCPSAKAKAKFQEYVIRRLTREGEYVRPTFTDTATAAAPPAFSDDAENGGLSEYDASIMMELDKKQDYAAQQTKLDEDEQMARELQQQFEKEAQAELERLRKYKVAGARRNMTLEEATLAISVLQSQREKENNFLLARVQFRVSLLGVYLKAKADRIAVLSQRNLAFYNTNKEIDLFHPRNLIRVTPSASLVDDKHMTLKGTSAALHPIKIKSNTFTYEITFASENERTSWAKILAVLIHPDENEDIDNDDEEETLLGLFNLQPQERLQAAMAQSKTCICGLPVSCRCSQCQVQQYCSRQCQKLHWRIHMSFCMPMHGPSQPVPTIVSAGSPPIDDQAHVPIGNGSPNAGRATIGPSATSGNNSNGRFSQAFKTVRGLVGQLQPSRQPIPADLAPPQHHHGPNHVSASDDVDRPAS